MNVMMMKFFFFLVACMFKLTLLWGAFYNPIAILLKEIKIGFLVINIFNPKLKMSQNSLEQIKN